MKKISFKKFALLMPMLALALSACNDKDDPYLGADLYGYAMQLEDLDNPGTFKYAPDIRAYTYSTSDVHDSWNFKKDGSSLSLKFSSPFRDAYEVLMPSSYYTDLASMNGQYSFEATNIEGVKASQSFTWAFMGEGTTGAINRPFTESWGENADSGDRDEATHYSKFMYENGTVKAIMKPFTNEGTSIAYAIMYARYEKIGLGGPNSNPETDPSSYRLSRVAGGISDPHYPSSPSSTTDIVMNLPLPNNSQNDFTEVALVAFKPVSNANGITGTVMMRTEYKTIRNGMNWFQQDGAPENEN